MIAPPLRQRLVPSFVALAGLLLLIGLSLTEEKDSAVGFADWAAGSSIVVRWGIEWSPVALSLAGLLAVLGLLVVWDRRRSLPCDKVWVTTLQLLLVWLLLGASSLVLQGAAFFALGLATSWVSSPGGGAITVSEGTRRIAAWEWLGGVLLVFVLVVVGLYVRGLDVPGTALTSDGLERWVLKSDGNSLHRQTVLLVTGIFLVVAMVRARTLWLLPSHLSRWGRLSSTSVFSVFVCAVSLFWLLFTWRSLASTPGSPLAWCFWIPVVWASLGLLRGARVVWRHGSMPTSIGPGREGTP